MFGAISEKIRTFDVQINFAIPQIFHFRLFRELISAYQGREIILDC